MALRFGPADAARAAATAQHMLENTRAELRARDTVLQFVGLYDVGLTMRAGEWAIIADGEVWTTQATIFALADWCSQAMREPTDIIRARLRRPDPRSDVTRRD